MLVMNAKMRNKYRQLLLAKVELGKSLNEIATSGFQEKDGCYFLDECVSIETNASINNFPDKTGYECFINSIHIDDYVNDGYLEQGVQFVQQVFSHWNELKNNQKLIAILSLDELGLNVKFHVQREGEQWLSDELEDYENSILIVDSSETEFH